MLIRRVHYAASRGGWWKRKSRQYESVVPSPGRSAVRSDSKCRSPPPSAVQGACAGGGRLGARTCHVCARPLTSRPYRSLGSTHKSKTSHHEFTWAGSSRRRLAVLTALPALGPLGSHGARCASLVILLPSRLPERLRGWRSHPVVQITPLLSRLLPPLLRLVY